MPNISGIGAAYLFKPDTDEMYALPASNFTFTEEADPDISESHSKTGCSVLLDADLVNRKSEFTLTLSTQILDQTAIEFILFNNREVSTPSFARPRLVTGVVGATVSGQVTVAGMTVDRPNTNVTILGITSPGDVPLLVQPDGTGVTPTTYENNAGFVEVDPIYDGRTASVIYLEDPATLDVIGGPNGIQAFTNLSFIGRFCTTRSEDKILYLPNISSLTGVQFDPKGDDFPREYRAFITPEFPAPYAVFNAA